MTDHYNLNAINAGARDIAQEALVERRAALVDRGLRWTVDIRRWFKDGRESSEICIQFYRDDSLVDFLEDFIVQDGEPVASTDELKQWLEQSIDAVLEENGRG